MNLARGIDFLLNLSRSPSLRFLVHHCAVNRPRIERQRLIAAVIEHLLRDYGREGMLGDISVFEAKNLQLIHDNLLLRRLNTRLAGTSDNEKKQRRLKATITNLEKRIEKLKPLEGPDALRFLARLYLEDIAPDFDPVFLIVFRTLAERIFKNFISSIQLHEATPGTLRAIRELSGREPLFFIANHISNADHLPILFALNRARIISPVVIGGSNLYHGISAKILPKVNVCQLKRDDMIERKIKWLGNPVYIETFKQHNQYMWLHNEPYLFYPEGGRSRSGMILRPKVGIIKNIFEFIKKTNRRAHFVLISLSYTCVPEDLAIEESRKGINISYSDIISQLAELNREYGSFKQTPTHVVLDRPLTITPEQIPDLEDFSFEMMGRICDNIRSTPTYEVARMIMNLSESREQGNIFSRQELQSATPPEQHRRLAAGMEIFQRKRFITPNLAGKQQDDSYRILNPDLLRQYANRTECEF